MDKITSYMRVTKKHRAPHDEALAAKTKTLGGGRGGVAAAKETPVAEQEEGDGEEYVPELIYKTVKYARKGDPNRCVSPMLQKVAAYIEAHYDVPRDFEINHKFGPHSGLTYEKRLARAYTQRLLQPKTANEAKTGTERAVKTPEPICIICAALGHSYKECPDGF